VTNTLAYFSKTKITAVKSFMGQVTVTIKKQQKWYKKFILVKKRFFFKLDKMLRIILILFFYISFTKRALSDKAEDSLQATRLLESKI
jgi:hypothetical protein